MKKTALLLLALFFVIPALSNAGSVSSRYDVTFGGFVKFDAGWNSQNQSGEPYVAERSSVAGNNWLKDEYSNSFMMAGETRLNFLIKGPELAGAKTSAFIEGDFRGMSTGNSYGAFQLRHAFMNLNWQSAELMIGQNWQQWGMPYYIAEFGFNDMSTYTKGVRIPQIAFRYFFTKEFNAMIGVQAATDWAGNGTTTGSRQYNDDYARSNWPGVMGEIAYWSDRCGKIGPNNLKFGLGGFYGKEKKITALTPVGTADPNTYRPSAPGYYDDTTNAWMAAFRYSVPIIPEKQGNKAMALLLTGNFFYGQNWAGNNWQNLGSTSAGSYFRPDSTATAPVGWGLMSQLSFWFTDKLWINAGYGYLKYSYSERARDLNAGNINMNQTYAANLMWDANQAIRFGLQWSRVFTGYNRGSVAADGTRLEDRTGTIDTYRVAAWYFF